MPAMSSGPPRPAGGNGRKRARASYLAVAVAGCALVLVLVLPALAPVFAGLGARASPSRRTVMHSLLDGISETLSSAAGVVSDQFKEYSAPASTREAMESVKDAMEAALRSGNRRVTIDFPRGLRLGLEGHDVESDQSKLRIPAEEVDVSLVNRGDRDLARLIECMFANVGSDLYYVFRTQKLESKARKVFSQAGHGGNVMSFEGDGKIQNVLSVRTSKSFDKRKKREPGDDFDIKAFANDLKMKQARFVVIVAPRKKQLLLARDLDELLKNDNIGIILLNSRLNEGSSEVQVAASKIFQPLVSLDLWGRPQQEGIIFKNSNSKWILAERWLEETEDFVGFKTKTLSQLDQYPSEEELRRTFSHLLTERGA